MKRVFGFLTVLGATLLLGMGAIPDAEAKRLGGGGSFGGKSAFSSPYQRQAAPARSMRQQQAVQQNQAARQQLSRRGGLMGMLGGLALGGLLGALLFGGAFEQFNFMDLLVFGGLAYLLYRVFAARGQAMSPRPAYARTRPGDSQSVAPRPVLPDNTAARTALDSREWFQADASAPSTSQQDAAARPADFDEQSFLDGARHAYRDLQNAWDARDFARLRALSTAAMFEELKTRSAGLSADNRTEVLKLDAELLDVREVGDDVEAVVLFDAILREDMHSRAQQVREVWHFTRPARSGAPTWFLDGIQQLED